MSDPMISTEALAARLGDPDLGILDATWFMPAENRSGRAEYEQAHIPGAVFYDIDALSDRDTDLPHMLPSPQALARDAGALGLRRNMSVVVYDHQGLFSAPRVWWTLRTLRFHDVSVLDGGLLKWRAEGRPVETGSVTPEPTDFEVGVYKTLVRDLETVKRTLDGGLAQVVDARAAARFRGEAPEPRPGLLSGHMPGALNVPWGGLVNADGTLKAPDELRAAFEAGGVDLDAPIVTTCGSGISAAILALGLARLGREDVPVYDGSWTEWASRKGAAIATG